MRIGGFSGRGVVEEMEFGNVRRDSVRRLRLREGGVGEGFRVENGGLEIMGEGEDNGMKKRVN